MAKYWMHNGFLQVEGKKMAKSEGNFVTIRALLADWPGEVLRFNMLRTHYRQPIDWTLNGLEESYNILRGFIDYPDIMAGDDESLAPSVKDALLDDLNTPKAIAELHALHNRGNFRELIPSLHALGFQGNLASPKAAAVDSGRVERLTDARVAARKAKNFAEADRIRDELDTMGIQLKDSRDPKTGELVTTWKVKR
jgi:cysteinyl-tRNA synthetase